LATVQIAKFGLLAYGFGWLAMLDCGFGATLEIGRKLVGNWSFLPLTLIVVYGIL